MVKLDNIKHVHAERKKIYFVWLFQGWNAEDEHIEIGCDIWGAFYLIPNSVFYPSQILCSLPIHECWLIDVYI